MQQNVIRLHGFLSEGALTAESFLYEGHLHVGEKAQGWQFSHISAHPT